MGSYIFMCNGFLLFLTLIQKVHWMSSDDKISAVSEKIDKIVKFFELHSIFLKFEHKCRQL